MNKIKPSGVRNFATILTNFCIPLIQVAGNEYRYIVKVPTGNTSNVRESFMLTYLYDLNNFSFKNSMLVHLIYINTLWQELTDDLEGLHIKDKVV